MAAGRAGAMLVETTAEATPARPARRTTTMTTPNRALHTIEAAAGDHTASATGVIAVVRRAACGRQLSARHERVAVPARVGRRGLAGGRR